MCAAYKSVPVFFESTVEIRLVADKTNKQQTGLRSEEQLHIQSILQQYCQAIDRIQLHELKNVFHSDAAIRNGSNVLTLAQFIDSVAERHPTVGVAFHMISNISVEFFHQHRAFVQSYCLAFESQSNSEQEPVERTFRVRYGDLFERRNGQWKISQRRVVIDHEQAIPAHLTKPAIFANEHNAGARNSDDAILQMRNTALRSL